MPDITDHLEEWVDEGFLSASQATAIRAYEGKDQAGRPTAILEILGYVGAVFVLVAAILVVVDLWADMSRAAKIVLAGSAAAVLVGAGLLVTRADHPRIRRVGSVVLLLALIPAGVAVGLVAETTFSEDTAVLCGMAAAALLGLALYARNRHSVAQHLGLFVSTMGVVLFAPIVIEDTSDWLPGLMLFIAGVVWVVLASFEVVLPRSLGEIAGSVAALFGAFTLVSSLSWEESGGTLVVMALCVIASLVSIVIGVARDRIFVVGGGMVGLIIFLPWLINEALGENIGAPVALLVAGSLLIGSAVYLSRRRAR